MKPTKGTKTHSTKGTGAPLKNANVFSTKGQGAAGQHATNGPVSKKKG